MWACSINHEMTRLTGTQITCLYDMDIPRPDNFNETYLYEGIDAPPSGLRSGLTWIRIDGM